MAPKLFICFLSVAAGSMIGHYFFKRENVREKYFDGMIVFCNYLVADIRFSQRTIAELIKIYLSDNTSPIAVNLNEYLCYLSGGQLNISKGYLKPSEYSFVVSFLKMLGTSDSATQVFEIENFKAKFVLFRENQHQRLDKYGKNYTKLGFLFGLALGILLM